MNMIVAVDRSWGIGKENNLLTHIPEDLKYFKRKTLGKVVVMGRKTLESLPGQKPLSERTNIILSSTMEEKEGCIICRNEKELFKELEKYVDEDIYIAGGAELYRSMLEHCDRFFVTRILKTFEADRFFENLDQRQELELVWEDEEQEHNGLKYKFTEYRRK